MFAVLNLQTSRFFLSPLVTNAISLSYEIISEGYEIISEDYEIIFRRYSPVIVLYIS